MASGDASLDDKLAGSVPFVDDVRGRRCWLATGAPGPRHPDSHEKAAITRFFNRTIVPEARGLGAAAMGGAALLYDLDTAALIGA